MKRRLTDQFPNAEVMGFAPDAEVPLPYDLRDKQPSLALGKQLLRSLPLWDSPPPSKIPAIMGSILLAGGILLTGLALENAWSTREQRNETWKTWLKQNELQSIITASRDKKQLWIKARGAPVPELFVHLSTVWEDGTKILDLEWNQGKIVLTAESSSALASLRKLTSDPWFHNVRVDDIRTQKSGLEVFSVEGGLSLDQ